MENIPQQSPRKGVSIWGTLAAMLVSFIGGIYVGLHPAWIPIKVTGGPDSSSPTPINMPTTLPIERMPMTMPTTAP